MDQFWRGLLSRLSFFLSRSESRRLERWRREERWREEERLQQIQREIKEAEMKIKKMKQEERKKREERKMIQEGKRRRHQEIAERQEEELIRLRRSMRMNELHLKEQREREEIPWLRKLEEEEELHLTEQREREELWRAARKVSKTKDLHVFQQKCVRDAEENLALPSTTSTCLAEPEDQQNQVADRLKFAFRSYMEALRPAPLENTRRTLDSIEMKLKELQIRVAGGVAGPVKEAVRNGQIQKNEGQEER